MSGNDIWDEAVSYVEENLVNISIEKIDTIS